MKVAKRAAEKVNRKKKKKKGKGNRKRAIDMGSRAWGKNDVGLIHNDIKTHQIKGQTKYKERGSGQGWQVLFVLTIWSLKLPLVLT